MKEKKADKILLITIFSLLFIGVMMFVSSSLGILNRSESTFYSVIIKQLVFGLPMGLLGMYLTYKINYKFWRKYAFYIFLGTIILTAGVFIPFLGFEHQGATRWIDVGIFSFQPVEFLKFGFIIYFAAWLSWMKNKAKNIK